MTGVALAPATSAGARELAIEREALLRATFFEQLPAALDVEADRSDWSHLVCNVGGVAGRLGGSR